MEKVKLVYFSPTGGTKKVMSALGEAWDSIEEVDLSEYGRDFSDIEIKEEDLVIFGMPSFAGRAPEVAMERMGQIKGNGAKAIIVVAYGARDYEDTLLEMKNACIEQGFQVIAAVAGVTEHSIARKIASGRPNESDQKEMTEFAKTLKQEIEEGKKFGEVKVKGQVPYKKVAKNPMKPKGNKNCTACGICVKSCPVGAIPMEKPRTVDTALCMNCMRCVSVCPEGARGIGSVIELSIELALRKMCKEDRKNEFIFG